MWLRALVGVAALLLVVLAAALLVPVVRDPRAARRRLEARFRRPEPTPAPPRADHYYRRYWS
jgi:peptidoglycan/LPS O-acetylase OafA/YrhL